MVYCVTVTVTLREAAQEPSFLAAFHRLHRHCQQHEPGTLSCELCMDDANPLRFHVVGRYNSRADYDEGHAGSAAMKEFVAFVEGAAAETSVVKMSSAQVDGQLRSMPKGAREPATSSSSGARLRQRKGVLVFCGARSGARASYTRAAEDLGKYLAVRAKVPLVYGGGTDGLMGTVARATKEHGGEVVAVLPHALAPQEAKGELIGDVVYMTETMSERKSIMFAHSYAVVTLPGGMGTFDELLEVMTLFLINAHRTKIGFLNVEGYFEPLFECVRNMIKEGFVNADCMDTFVVRPTAEELMDALESFEPSQTVPLEWRTRP